MLLAQTDTFRDINLSLYALLGAGSMMSGMLRMKAPLAVMLVEATDDGTVGPGLVLIQPG